MTNFCITSYKLKNEKNMNYEMSQGGRVKAAGLPFSMFTDPAAAYLGNPNAHNAVERTDAYVNLRKSPPDVVEIVFFRAIRRRMEC